MTTTTGTDLMPKFEKAFDSIDVVRKAAEKRDDTTLAGLRKRQGVTQVELADRLGITQASLSALESRARPKLESVVAYIEALGGEVELVAHLGKKRHVVDLDVED